MQKTPVRVEDEELLDLLRANARMSTAALSRRLGVARSTVQGRLERLERGGVIRGYTVQLAPSARQRLILAHVMINLEPQQQGLVERKLKAISAVTSIWTVSGAFDLIALVAAESTEALDRALDSVRECAGVKSTVTSIVLSTRLDR